MTADGALDLTEKHLRCPDCGAAWVLEAHVRRWFVDRGLREPRRCESCRRARREASAASDGTRERTEPAQTILRMCRECSRPFEILPDMQAWIARKGLALPARCRHCRESRRDAQDGQ